MSADNLSVTSSTPSKPKTPMEGKRVGFARPTLYIPPPQGMMNNPQSRSANISSVNSVPHQNNMYGRKASVFVFDQFNNVMNTAKSGMGLGEKCAYWMYNKVSSWSKKWFTHCFLSIVIVLYTIGGALVFVAIEGQNEEKIVEGDIRRDRYSLIRELRNLSIELPYATSVGEWEGEAARRLMDFESKVIDAYQKHSLIVANRGEKIWTVWNAMVYCSTIYTTMGYGHMYPTTTTGRALTIVYSIIGIPLFLIALTDFGKLFTRCIKFFWAFVRRVYYTGSCRQVRKTAHVREIFKGAQMMYEIATFRRQSQTADPENPVNFQQPPPFATSAKSPNVADETPTTPALSNFEIDDEFNLPISVAIFILLLYIFLGALIYCAWEHWDFFASFYFVFISMSTIGFGDFVPRHPICMIVSIVYLVFGLALMSMCINVVQVKLSDTFKQASHKIGATMGLSVDEDGSVCTVAPDGVEMPNIHGQNNINEKTPTSEHSLKVKES